MDLWIRGFALALNGTNILWLLGGALVGLVVGVLPGLGPTFGVALMLPFTYGLDPATALIFLCAIHGACCYGDSFSSIMINVPGGPGTVATCWDGHPMAKKGLAGKALGVATMAGVVGGVVSWLSLAVLARPVTDFAFMIGPPEYFALGLMALGLISVGSRGETIKGLIMASVGLALSFIGPDPVTGVNLRFGFGIDGLEGGIPAVIVALGVFAIAQVVVMIEEGGSISEQYEIKDSVWAGFVEAFKYRVTLLRAGLVGWFVGIMPAMGIGLAGISAYLIEKKYNPEREQFGQGHPAGLAAAEVGKGACVIGDLIPTFTLGIPGSATGAILMVALIMHGVQPGPQFMVSGVAPYAVFAGLLLTQMLYIPISLFFGKWLTKIVYLPSALLAPVIAALCFLGAYAERNVVSDLALMVALGVAAYFLEKRGYSVVCLVLGIILGPLIESNFHRALGVGLGNPSIFFTRPLALVFLLVTLGFVLWPYLQGIRRWMAARRERALQGQPADAEEQKITWDEFVIAGILTALLLLFLIDTRSYGPAVGLFPRVVTIFGLVMLSALLIGIILTARRQGKVWPIVIRPAPALYSGALSWKWSVGLLLAYIALVSIIGFAVASGIFIIVTAILMGYRRHWVTVLGTVGVVFCIVLFAQIVRIQLPVGLIFEMG